VLWKNYVLSSASQKVAACLSPKKLGPCKIKNRISAVIYELESKSGKSLGNWHVKDLNLHHARS
jgi:hypothetical protein